MRKLHVMAAAALGAAWLLPGAEAAEKPIKVAVLDALSGAYAQYGQPTIYGARYVFDKVNAAGGLFGRKIELVSEDDGCSPKQAVGGATKLAADEDVRRNVLPGCPVCPPGALPDLSRRLLTQTGGFFRPSLDGGLPLLPLFSPA